MGKNGKNELTEHPLNLVFSDRNKGSIITKFGLMKLLVQSVILRGNGFALIERANDGTVIGLRYLENNDVNIVYDKVRNSLYYDVPILKRHVEPKDMIHLIIFTYDGVKGLSILQNAARSLAIAHANDIAAKNFFENGCNVRSAF